MPFMTKIMNRVNMKNQDVGVHRLLLPPPVPGGNGILISVALSS